HQTRPREWGLWPVRVIFALIRPVSCLYPDRMARGRTAKVLVQHVEANGDAPRITRSPDELIVEEPLEIRLDGHLVTTTMRTPGDDFELAVGLCLSDGLLGGAAVTGCRYCGESASAVDTEFNVVTVETGGHAPVPIARVATT